jgi:hypothetical protein
MKVTWKKVPENQVIARLRRAVEPRGYVVYANESARPGELRWRWAGPGDKAYIDPAGMLASLELLTVNEQIMYDKSTRRMAVFRAVRK